MLTALVLATLTQLQVVVGSPAPVIFGSSAPVIFGSSAPVLYELPTVQAMEYEPLYVPVLRARSTVAYSFLPEAYYLRTDPLVRVYPPYLGRRTVIKERGPGFWSRTVMRW